MVVATKVFGATGPGPNNRGNSRAHIIDGVKASLKRLQMDHIDLYQIHGFDPATPIEETVRALDTLVQHGEVRYVGVSNWAAWQIVTALGIAERLGLSRFDSLQVVRADKRFHSVERLELPKAKSPFSTSMTLRPRMAASLAMPAPLIPPPTTSRS